MEIAAETGFAQEIVAVAADDPHFADVVAMDGISPQRRAALEKSLAEYGPAGEGKLRWLGSGAATETVRKARQWSCPSLVDR